MFCNKCGAKLDDNAVFCTNCGAKIENAAPAAETAAAAAPEAAPSKIPGGHKTVGVIAAAIIAIVVIALLCSIFGGRSIKSTVSGVLKNWFGGKVENVVDYLPQAELKKMLKDNEDSTIKEYKQDMRDAYDLRYGETKLRLVKYKITDTEDLTQAQLGEIAEQLGVKKVNTGKNVSVHITYKQNGETREADVNLVLIKMHGKWCIAPTGIARLFFIF
ncbi:MAG: zinc ribbon domain-containing protein [Clostridiales bacterium]|nr:zinc ribbon domain-containing protein [Clostridiales bacterium]